MNPIVKNIIAVIVGLVVGHFVNFSLIKLGHTLFPIEGIDPNNLEDLARVMPTLDFKYFVFPFLAHALGTLAGAMVAAFLAANHKMKFALGIGVAFLLGGIMASIMIPAPTWFVATDLIMAYLPMAWIGGKLVSGIAKK
ncbi:MAG: hypothetical protein AB3N16_01565 [Flavobacteriaceae bacterium]